MHYDKYLICKNVRTLMESSDVRLGAIETESHNGPGYMSRLEKPDNNTDPNFEFIATAAQMLGVPLDALVYSDIAELNKSELTLLKFVNKLVTKTRDESIFWEKMSGTAHFECNIKENGYHIAIERYENEKINYELSLNGDCIYDFSNSNKTIYTAVETLYKEIEIKTSVYRIKPETRDLMTAFMNEKE